MSEKEKKQPNSPQQVDFANMPEVPEEERLNWVYENTKRIIYYINTLEHWRHAKFKSLDEYADFVDWQKSQGIECDILYLQYTTDTQNNDLIQFQYLLVQNILYYYHWPLPILVCRHNNPQTLLSFLQLRHQSFQFFLKLIL